MSVPANFFPPFHLVLRTPRLVLRPISDADIPAAVEAALSGVHEPGRNPFSSPWTETPAPELGSKMAQWYWHCRAGMSPESWALPLGVWHGGRFIGCQDVAAKDFATLRTVTTGSWLRRSAQGRGFGKEMRAAAAMYAFSWLGAEVAESDAAVWNQQSLGVSRSLGYQLNGITRAAWAGKAQDVQKMRLTPATLIRPGWQLDVDGHASTAKYLGIAGGAQVRL